MINNKNRIQQDLLINQLKNHLIQSIKVMIAEVLPKLLSDVFIII